MIDNAKIIYRLDDKISFRQCTLFNSKSTSHGDCTCFYDEPEEDLKSYYHCSQDGIHLHCTKHPEIELDCNKQEIGHTILRCPKCKEEFEIYSLHTTINKCLRMINILEFKDAKIVRLDDWYVPEIKKKEKISPYWIKTDVKTDGDGDTIIIVYIGHTGTKEKTQFFIKPEKLQLTSDHKDLDPSKILSKIEITLRDRTLSQKYDTPE